MANGRTNRRASVCQQQQKQSRNFGSLLLHSLLHAILLLDFRVHFCVVQASSKVVLTSDNDGSDFGLSLVDGATNEKDNGGSSVEVDTSIEKRKKDGDDDQDFKNENNEEEKEESMPAKQYRYNQGRRSSGRLKVRFTSTIFDNTIEDKINTSPWTKNVDIDTCSDTNVSGNVDKNDDEMEQSNDSDDEMIGPNFEEKSNYDDLSPQSSLTLVEKLLPFMKRGILLFALSAFTVLERKGSPLVSSSSSIILSPLTIKKVKGLSFKIPTFDNFIVTINTILPKFNWKKLYKLPTEILPSVSCALLIAWVPTLLLQGSWWELSFIIVSFTSSQELRRYTQSQIFPTMYSTIQKLIWSEFWKHIWDYLLRPFPGNIFIPPPTGYNFDQQQSIGNENSFLKMRSYLIQVWTKRVNVRIDKWTTSSLKSLLQKNFQSSVTKLVEDSFRFIFTFSSSDTYASYYNHDTAAVKKLDPVSVTIDDDKITNEDIRRMVEIEDETNDYDTTGKNTSPAGNEQTITTALTSASISEQVDCNNDIDDTDSEVLTLSDESHGRGADYDSTSLMPSKCDINENDEK